MIDRIAIEQKQVVIAIASPHKQPAHAFRPSGYTRKPLQGLDNICFTQQGRQRFHPARRDIRHPYPAVQHIRPG